MLLEDWLDVKLKCVAEATDNTTPNVKLKCVAEATDNTTPKVCFNSLCRIHSIGTIIYFKIKTNNK
jgi:hypothetical protein